VDDVTTGHLYGVGVGPGDPDLLTVRAAAVLDAVDVVAHFAAVGRPSNARRVVADRLDERHQEVRLEYPVTTEALPADVSYETLLIDFYDASAKQVAEHLDRGADVAVICEGDPFLYGSYMYLHTRLAHRFPTTVVPGVTSILASAATLGAPLACRDEVLSVLSGVLPVDELTARLRACDAAVVMKVGRNLGRVREAVTRAGLLERATYVERATMAGERVCPLADADPATAPYFSMVVVPSRLAAAR
jgi:precorrin-2/cobalt-factor-2 C20-methyltransferase